MRLTEKVRELEEKNAGLIRALADTAAVAEKALERLQRAEAVLVVARRVASAVFNKTSAMIELVNALVKYEENKAS